MFGLFRQSVDYNKAFGYFYEGKMKGDDHSLAMVGFMYYYGLGVQRDIGFAREMFLKGIKKNIGLCYNGLGLMHLRGDYAAGKAGSPDPVRAFKLFKSKTKNFVNKIKKTQQI